MQHLFSIALVIYLIFYSFEGLIRYGFHLVGADYLIFIRDAILMLPMIAIFITQFLRRNIHPAYIIFFLVILLHGTVMMLNTGVFLAVAYGAKMLMTLVAGAIGMRTFFNPGRKTLITITIIWIISMGAVFVDKYYVDFPWMGMETNIGDIKVDIGRDWQVSGADKRAGGFMRSSINVATIIPLIAIMLVFNLKYLPLRVMVGALTIPVLIWTTQKGPIIAYMLVLGLLSINPKRPLNMLRLGLFLTIIMAVALPEIFDGYTMPSTGGVFSLSSFYLRIEWMWPNAWIWIHSHEAFPFGVGLGGISGAQRLYAINDMNAADNIFILMYAYFGVMTFVYLGAVLVTAIKINSTPSNDTSQAMATLVFLFGYGCVISLLEDQMATVFMGAALACICEKIKTSRQNNINNQGLIAI